MRKYKVLLVKGSLLMTLAFLVAPNLFAQQKNKQPVDYVDNFIGVIDGPDASSV